MLVIFCVLTFHQSICMLSWLLPSHPRLCRRFDLYSPGIDIAKKNQFVSSGTRVWSRFPLWLLALLSGFGTYILLTIWCCF